MDFNDIEKFQRLMTGISENFSSVISDAGVDLMFESLKMYSYEQVYDAAIKVLRTRHYTNMPTVADYVTYIEGSKDDQAEYQFTVVLRAIRQLGNSGYPKFKDPITQDLVDHRFGWSKICQTNQKDMEFFARDFKSAYVNRERNGSIMIADNSTPKNVIDLLKIKTIAGGHN